MQTIPIAGGELTFVGAAGTVTGSKHLLTLGSRHVFIDCGLYQGDAETEALNLVPLPVAADEIHAIVVTHGHLDHIGYLPIVVRAGYRGPIYATPATARLAEIVLEDAAKLQLHQHERRSRRDRPHLVPFFDDDDVCATLRCMRTIDVETDFSIAGARFRYHDAGHIPGAAYVAVQTGASRTIFSGDLGRYGNRLLADPTPIGTADVVVCEGTYGDRDHPADALDELERVLGAGIERGGPIVIPAFAVERTQDILHAIGVLQARNPVIARVPVHLDSPMAIKVNAVFAEFLPIATIGNGPAGAFGCRNLTFHVTSDESKRLNHLDGPAIVIASSGMAAGGRILYHLHRRLPDPRATVAFVGFQVRGTLGHQLVGGSRSVRILGDVVPVLAQVIGLQGFSAHADRRELLRWLGTIDGKPRVYVVHAEPETATRFAANIDGALGFTATVAQRGTSVRL